MQSLKDIGLNYYIVVQYFLYGFMIVWVYLVDVISFIN